MERIGFDWIDSIAAEDGEHNYQRIEPGVSQRDLFPSSDC